MEGNKRTRRRRHSGLERLKSLLILLLTLSAVALTYRVLMYSDFAGTAPKGWLGGLLSLFSAEQTPSVSENNPLGQAGAAAQPVETGRPLSAGKKKQKSAAAARSSRMPRLRARTGRRSDNRQNAKPSPSRAKGIAVK